MFDDEQPVTIGAGYFFPNQMATHIDQLIPSTANPCHLTATSMSYTTKSPRCSPLRLELALRGKVPWMPCGRRYPTTVTTTSA